MRRLIQENFCAISPDGTFVAIGGADGTVCINYLATQVTVYSTESNSRVRTFLFSSVLIVILKVTGVAWSPDGKRLIVVTSYGIDIQIANTNSRKTVFNLNSEVRILFGAVYFLIRCLGLGMCV